MLFKRRALEGIAEGSITLAFRRWRQPQARPGTRLRTAIGVLAVDSVDVVAPSALTEDDAQRAGFDSRAALMDELGAADRGPIHRVALRLAGADPREALRAQSALAAEELDDVRRRLARLDRASRRGPWTMSLLRLIADRPGVRAADLAAGLDRERLAFKADVRKLKELGLTESLEVGYRLSPRGRAVLRAESAGPESPRQADRRSEPLDDSIR
jgi:hypothetical protein